MAKTAAQKNRAIRQEALREQLSKQKHVEQVIKNIIKMEELDEESQTFKNSLEKLRTANDQRMKLVNKYLPDLKQVEMEASHDHSLPGEILIKIKEHDSKA